MPSVDGPSSQPISSPNFVVITRLYIKDAAFSHLDDDVMCQKIYAKCQTIPHLMVCFNPGIGNYAYQIVPDFLSLHNRQTDH